MPVAPHENCEVRLVLSGSKPLATIEKKKDPFGYSIAVSLSKVGMLKGKISPTTDSNEGEIVFVKPNNEKLLSQYFDLLQNGIKRLGIKQYHREMGRLFGYSEQDIEDFIAVEINCNCTKCRGK